MRRLFPLIPVLVLFFPSAARAQLVFRHAGHLTIRADQSLAFPGGLLAVHLQSRRRLGVAYAVLDGRRCPFFPGPRGLRALVPIPSRFPPGPVTLGIEVRGARGRQRVAVPVEVAPRDYPERTVVIPESKRPLVVEPTAVRDGRHLQLLLRTVSPERLWRGPFQPPVAAEPVYSYGAPMSYVGASPVEANTDAVHGEYHRGLDYPVPPGTVAQAPAAGTVLLAAPLALTGQTVVIDHGQGVLSVFFHLSRTSVREGDWVEGRAPVALSGESGLTAEPHLHWAVYLLGVAVDPRVMERLGE